MLPGGWLSFDLLSRDQPSFNDWPRAGEWVGPSPPPVLGLGLLAMRRTYFAFRPGFFLVQQLLPSPCEGWLSTWPRRWEPMGNRIDGLVEKAGLRLACSWTDAKKRFVEVGLRALHR
jgi:hypothetical protein